MAVETSDPDAAPPPAGATALDFRAVYEAHARAVRRFLGDLLRDDGAADEATQETFVRAHARLGTLRADDRVLPWLFGIARNVFYEELRARKRHLRSIDASEPDERDAEPDRAPSPEGLLLGAEADAQLQAALGLLGEERRTALVLRIDHGLDYDEIAAVMGWPLSKVKNEIHRARLVLRERLAKYVGGKA